MTYKNCYKEPHFFTTLFVNILPLVALILERKERERKKEREKIDKLVFILNYLNIVPISHTGKAANIEPAQDAR